MLRSLFNIVSVIAPLFSSTRSSINGFRCWRGRRLGDLTNFHCPGFHAKDFLPVLHNKGGQQVHQNYDAAFFPKKFLFGPMGYILVWKMTLPYNSESAVRIFQNFEKWKAPKGRSKIYYLNVINFRVGLFSRMSQSIFLRGFTFVDCHILVILHRLIFAVDKNLYLTKLLFLISV